MRDFVRRTGSTLTLDGLPYRFHGNNVYFNQSQIAYGNAGAVEEVYDKMAALGMTVARANAHNDHPPANDPAAIQTAPGVYNEANLAALDQSIALAKARGIRLILKFTNYWEAYGGIRRYAEWHLNRTPTKKETSLFYTEPRIKAWFQHYIQTIINRYRDETAILAWELGNELRNPGNADALLNWTAETAAFIRQLDPNHLIADGGEGFDDAPDLYKGISDRYTVNGAEGGSFHRLAQIPELDLLSYHLYPFNWRMNETDDTTLYIRRHEEIARQAGKVAYMGEYGKPAPDAPRAALFDQWLHSAINHRTAGVILWQLLPDSMTDHEGYQVYSPRDTATCEVLRDASGRINRSTVIS